MTKWSLKPVEPAHGVLAHPGQAVEHAVAGDAFVVADLDRGRVDEADPGGLAQAAGHEVGEQGHHGAGDPFHKASIGDQVGEIMAVMGQQVEIEVFERAEVAGLEGDEDGHDLAEGQACIASATAWGVDQLPLLELGLEALGEIVHVHEKFGKIHVGLLANGVVDTNSSSARGLLMRY